jgi:acetyl-CoA carboxylase carboxyltransferase component
VIVVVSPLVGTVIAVKVQVGDEVDPDSELILIESMKMEHPVYAGVSAIVSQVLVAVGGTVASNQTLVILSPGSSSSGQRAPQSHSDKTEDTQREDLLGYQLRRQRTTDAARPDAVRKRHERNQRTIRENIADLCDEGSFIEYGTFAIAAQRQRRNIDELIDRTPGDGLVSGLGTVNGELFDLQHSRCAFVGYDYTVLAGTQGFINHRKKDRLFAIIEKLRLPVVLFAEGGGGRPGDTDAPGVAGLDVMSFANFARLSGLAPTIGIASGYCFAGNAALLGCCDVIIATENSNIGMAGPAMIEGGGLGVVSPTEIGPIDVQSHNGVVDIRVADEVAAVSAAKKYLAFFQGTTANWMRHSDESLRSLIPEQRSRIYDIRTVITQLADIESVLELRSEFGVGIVTALARIEGRPIGIMANNPAHLGGAIDSDAADKAARFAQLCDAYDLPIISLCDTPGFMVGPDAERDAQVRHFSRMFVTAASVTIPWLTVVLRKGYGLGAQAMAGGSFHATEMIVSWPTGEFGGMGLEGAVRLGFKRELDSTKTPAERVLLEAKLIADAYHRGSALNMASHVEIDDVIDPADTRLRLLTTLDMCPVPLLRTGKKRPMIDTW